MPRIAFSRSLPVWVGCSAPSPRSTGRSSRRSCGVLLESSMRAPIPGRAPSPRVWSCRRRPRVPDCTAKRTSVSRSASESVFRPRTGGTDPAHSRRPRRRSRSVCLRSGPRSAWTHPERRERPAVGRAWLGERRASPPTGWRTAAPPVRRSDVVVDTRLASEGAPPRRRPGAHPDDRRHPTSSRSAGIATTARVARAARAKRRLLPHR